MPAAREFVHARVEGPIAYLEIDRPPVNAYNLQTHREIYEALAELESNHDLCCVIMYAGGVAEGRPFSAGSDIKEFVGLDPRTSLDRSMYIRRYFASVSDFPLPVVAAVENVTLGSGFAYAARADIRVLSTTASLGMPEVKVGALGGGYEMVRLVGIGKAREMYYTGRRIDAEEALRLGFAQQVVPPGEALAAARQIGLEMAEVSPFGLRLAKEQMRFAESPLTRDEALRYETELTALYRALPDASESASSFLERRKPTFSRIDG
jgi:enoyl-CoA hydratase/carnithine racemase